MKTISLKVIALSAVVAIGLSACSKSSDNPIETITPPSGNTTGTTPSFADGYGALAAVSTISYQLIAGTLVPITLNTGVAAFYTTAGSGSMSDAGAVTLNGKALTKQSNNSYVYSNYTDPLLFSGTVTWTVAGSSTVPAISASDDKPIPSYSDYASLPVSITRSAGFTLDLSGKISGADSVYVVIVSSSGQIIKHLSGSPSQCVFTPAELGTLAASSTGIIEVCPWNYKSEDFSSKKFYFVNEGAFVKSGIAIN